MVGALADHPKPNTTILLMEVYHMAITDEGLYAELMRFHQSGEGEQDDLPWKESWDEEDAYLRQVVR